MPSLQSLGEFGLIEKLKALLPPAGSEWPTAIGDDAAVLRLSPQRYLLFTQDLLIEDVHFRLGSKSDWSDLGWKSLAVNLSDIAAMGGKPKGAVIGLALPKKTPVPQLEAFYRGMAQAARHFACPIVGGDTNVSPAGLTISVALLGETRKPPLLRSGARPGDSLWVTGTLGAAALGWISAERKLVGARAFRIRHARPQPRLDWGRDLASSGMVGAAMDLSDGLAGDLAHMSRASRIGFSVDLDLLPRPRGFSALCRKLKLSEERLMVAGGEDYELLFALRSGKEERFEKYCRSHRIQATRIGEAKKTRGLLWHRSGKSQSLSWQGYRHFS